MATAPQPATTTSRAPPPPPVAGDDSHTPFVESLADDAAPPLERGPEPTEKPKPIDPDALPPMRADPRNAIARRAREARADALGQDRRAPLNIERSSIPEGIPVEGDEDYIAGEGDDRPAAEARQEQRREEPRPDERREDAPRPQSYKLKVYGNEVGMNRAELLRYAGLDEADAEHVPEASLIRLAQKQIAADENFEASKQVRKGTRPAAPDASSTHEEDQRPSPDGQRQDERKTKRKELIRAIQMGDEDEAERALDELTRTTAREVVANQRQTDKLSDVQDDLGTAVNRFGSENADIMSDPVASAAHRGLLVSYAIDELRRVVPDLEDRHVTRMVQEPGFAMHVYSAALADGAPVSKPADLLSKAGSTVRQKFGMAAPGDVSRQVPQQQEALPPRGGKDRLPHQPTRSESQREQRNAAPARKSSSDVIRDMRRFRHQAV